MARINRLYTLVLANGDEVKLKASNLAMAHQEGLAHFGARLSYEDVPGAAELRWRQTVVELRRGTPATEQQVAALMAIRGIGAEACRKLALLAGKATVPLVLKELRGKVRWRVSEVVAILNSHVAAHQA
jgi:hypothetical protein